MTDSKLTIAGLGEILWDVYGSQKFLGGAPANFARHVRRLGHRAFVLSRVGQDTDGTEILNQLKDEGVDTAFIQIDPQKPTGTVAISLDEAGEPIFDCRKDVAFDYLRDYPADNPKMPKFDAVLFGTLAQRNSISRKTIQDFIKNSDAGLIVFDANLRGVDEKTRSIVELSLWNSDMVKLNETEWKFLTELFEIRGVGEQDRFAGVLKKFHLKLICLTLGKMGSLAVTEDQIAYSPGYNIPVVDATGCGDAFIAGFLVNYLHDKPLTECLESSNIRAAFVAAHKGAVPDVQTPQLREWARNYRERNCDSRYERFIRT